MLSRIAESLFWIGRYLERAEDLARIVDVAYHSRLERVGNRRRSASDWEPLLAISGERERFFDKHSVAGARSVARFLTFDSDNPNSILSCVKCARENARGMRDRITSEMWETLNTFYLWISERSLLQEVSVGNLHALYSSVKERCHLFGGVAEGTMAHDEGWEFLQLGKFLERASMTARILQVHYPGLLDDETTNGHDAVHDCMWLLRSVSAYEAYCKAFHLGIRPELVAGFLVFNDTFPRSIRYAVGSAEIALKRVSNSRAGQYGNSAERALGRLHAGLAYDDRRELTDSRLQVVLQDVQNRCAEVSDGLIKVYFAYKVPGANAGRSSVRSG